MRVVVPDGGAGWWCRVVVPSGGAGAHRQRAAASLLVGNGRNDGTLRCVAFLLGLGSGSWWVDVDHRRCARCAAVVLRGWTS